MDNTTNIAKSHDGLSKISEKTNSATSTFDNRPIIAQTENGTLGGASMSVKFINDSFKDVTARASQKAVPNNETDKMSRVMQLDETGNKFYATANSLSEMLKRGKEVSVKFMIRHLENFNKFLEGAIKEMENGKGIYDEEARSELIEIAKPKLEEYKQELERLKKIEKKASLLNVNKDKSNRMSADLSDTFNKVWNGLDKVLSGSGMLPKAYLKMHNKTP